MTRTEGLGGSKGGVEGAGSRGFVLGLVAEDEEED